jgi:DNA-binding transcriptional ArsR family regulator
VPDDVTKIADVPALRALADPIRLRVLDLLGSGPRTVKELAGLLDVPRTRLHYHVNVLERHGLINVASTRVVNGATERTYEAAGRTFEVDRLSVPRAAAAGVAASLAGLLHTTAQELDDSLRSQRRTAVGTGHVRLTQSQHLELVNRIQALIDEYEAAPADDGDATTIVFALYGDKP